MKKAYLLLGLAVLAIFGLKIISSKSRPDLKSRMGRRALVGSPNFIIAEDICSSIARSELGIKLLDRDHFLSVTDEQSRLMKTFNCYAKQCRADEDSRPGDANACLALYVLVEMPDRSRGPSKGGYLRRAARLGSSAAVVELGYFNQYLANLESSMAGLPALVAEGRKSL